MDNKYIKITYQSEPIGKEGIVLYLTTFDWEYNNKNQLIPKESERRQFFPINKLKLDDERYLETLEQELNMFVERYYEPAIKQLQRMIENEKTIFRYEDLDVKDITNADNVRCNIVYGDIKNCNNIYCNGIKGNVVNCDKIIYR